MKLTKSLPVIKERNCNASLVLDTRTNRKNVSEYPLAIRFTVDRKFFYHQVGGSYSEKRFSDICTATKSSSENYKEQKMCEELGRGWDRMVLACEAQYLPAPRIEVFQDSTKVTLFSEMEFSNIPMEDKLWSCYLHACLMYIQGDALTNKSLRDRFGIPETSSSSSSRLIKEAIGKNLIKVLDPNTAPRYMKYIPIWA